MVISMRCWNMVDGVEMEVVKKIYYRCSMGDLRQQSEEDERPGGGVVLRSIWYISRSNFSLK